MLFNSFDFAVYLPIVFILYWFVVNRSLKTQNILIVCASYFFYGYWDWRFLSLLFFSSSVDYFVGYALGETSSPQKRTRLLWISIIINLGTLGFFKYFNFFIDNFITAFSFFGIQIQPNTLNIILPVGISFYTFQSLSYTIDIFKRRLRPTHDLISFLAFVSFFPQLVAGPIERATHLLPQFFSKRSFDYTKAVDGSRQILWGLFKKVVLADNCAKFANDIFGHSATSSGSTLLLGIIFFSIQIYCDFSGYSDIAIGTSRLFGFDLKRNFNYPYFSRDIAEFWRRWHISLSTWFRDYLYIPLGGSKGGTTAMIRNVFIIFIVSGFWHGANWTFIFWGFLNALYYLPLLLSHKNRTHTDAIAPGKLLPDITTFFKIVLTFVLTMIARVFFRAESLSHAFQYLQGMVSMSLFTLPNFPDFNRSFGVLTIALLFFFIEWIGRESQYALESLGCSWRRPFRHIMYYILIFIILSFGGTQQDFIYFQF